MSLSPLIHGAEECMSPLDVVGERDVGCPRILSLVRLGQPHEAARREVPRRSSQYMNFRFRVRELVCTTLRSYTVSLAGCTRFIDPKTPLPLPVHRTTAQPNRNSSNLQLSNKPTPGLLWVIHRLGNLSL